MPHVIVKLYSGRSERDKSRLAAEITKAVKPDTIYNKPGYNPL